MLCFVFLICRETGEVYSCSLANLVAVSIDFPNDFSILCLPCLNNESSKPSPRKHTTNINKYYPKKHPNNLGFPGMSSKIWGLQTENKTLGTAVVPFRLRFAGRPNAPTPGAPVQLWADERGNS